MHKSALNTILIIAHSLQTVCIHVMEAGRLIERGQFEDLLASGGKFAQLWNAQTHPPLE